MTEETNIATEQQPDDQQLADPYNANAIDLATQAISIVGNVLAMLAKSSQLPPHKCGSL